jgi:hypothetical protein
MGHSRQASEVTARGKWNIDTRLTAQVVGLVVGIRFQFVTCPRLANPFVLNGGTAIYLLADVSIVGCQNSL